MDFYDIVRVASSAETAPGDLILVLDRNVLSRAFELLTPSTISLRDEHRLAAAVFAYAQLTNTLFDPSIAVAETVFTNGEHRGTFETLEFVAYQNIPTQLFLDIVAGRAERIDREHLEAEKTPSMIAGVKDLQQGMWERFFPDYAAALKLACLINNAGPLADGEKLMSEFMRWCYEDFIFVAPAFMYGSLALSPAKKSSMFKRIYSDDGPARLRGARNAAWDMAIIRAWMDSAKRVLTDMQFPIVCSFDAALLRCAEDSMTSLPLSDGQRLSHVENLLMRDWGDAVGKRLFCRYSRYAIGMATNAGRAGVKDPHRMERWRRMVGQMECELGVIG